MEQQEGLWPDVRRISNYLLNRTRVETPTSGRVSARTAMSLRRMAICSPILQEITNSSSICVPSAIQRPWTPSYARGSLALTAPFECNMRVRFDPHLPVLNTGSRRSRPES